MRTPLAGLLAVALLAGACGRTQADQQKDGAFLANTLRTAWNAGTAFTLDQQLQLAGGDIASGQSFQLHGIVSSGQLRGSTARFGYRLDQAQAPAAYDMLVAGGLLYVRKQGATAWKATSLSGATTLFPALRLDLLRETVLLASSVSAAAYGSFDVGSPVGQRYVVRPAPDQLEELQSVSVDGAAARQFLRSASGEVDLYLTVPGDRLGMVDVRLSGIDPSNGEKQDIRSTLRLRSAKVGPIEAPADAQVVSTGEILT
jgi:hypothetical protein